MTKSESTSPISDAAEVSVAILAGGLSSRMGSNKALLRLDPAGPTMLERVIDATSTLGGDRFIVSRSNDDYRDFQLPVAADRYPDTGVLGAIGTAIHRAACQRVLVVSCDMPFLSRQALSWMASVSGHFDAVVPVVNLPTRQGGSVTFQTLHAIYAKSCLSFIESALQRGDLRSVAFLDQVAVRHVSEAELKRFDPGLLTLLSVNTPEDLHYARTAQRLIQREERGEF